MSKKKTVASRGAGSRGIRPSTKPPRGAAKPDANFEPAPGPFAVTTPNQLRSLAVPLRLKILRCLSERAMTTKQVAVELNETATKLYHHVDALADAGLIVLVRETPKRGTTERYYRAVAHSFRADEECFTEGDDVQRDARVDTMLQLVDATRRGLIALDGQRASTAVAASSAVAATPAEAQRLMKLLVQALAQWEKSKPARSKANAELPLQVSIFIHPSPPT
jgi:DNA-binding transcriptional ArsR family regulator